MRKGRHHRHPKRRREGERNDRYTINLVEMADTAEGGELQCGCVDLTYNPCGDRRTFKATLERGCDTIPCYIPKFGDECSTHMPWAYMSMLDPRFFPKGAVLEQVDVMQLGKSINFCIAPFAPHCRIGSVFASRDQANQLSHDLCRVRRRKIGNCRGSAFRLDGSTLMQSSKTGTTTYFHQRPRRQNDTWASWK